MSDLEEKFISDTIKLGCSRRNAAATYQVYLELCEVRRLFDVKYYFNNDLKRMYMTAKSSKSSEPLTFLPICSSENVSFNDMQALIEISTKKEIILAILTADSNCCYYQISSGLPVIKSTNPKVSMLKKREQHDVEINSKRAELERNLGIRALPPCIEDDGSRMIIGPVSRQWYDNCW